MSRDAAIVFCRCQRKSPCTKQPSHLGVYAFLKLGRGQTSLNLVHSPPILLKKSHYQVQGQNCQGSERFGPRSHLKFTVYKELTRWLSERQKNRLEAADRPSPLLAKSEKSKATSDGEDLLTPLVERAASAIASTVTRK
jgi:hypothetical protein